MLRTVFVIGAGASAEFGLGVGTTLATEIREVLRDRVSEPHAWLTQRDKFGQAINGLQSDAEQIVRAAETIRRGLPFSASIDDFLYEHRDNELVMTLAKISIAQCMLRQEQKAPWLKQLADPRLESRVEAFSQLRETWLDRLFRILKRGKSRAEAREVFANCSFVVFNYDRCIQQYLYPAFAEALDLTAEEAKAVADSISIEHVYGNLGTLPFQAQQNVIDFAAEHAELEFIAKRLKTYSEELSSTTSTIVHGWMNEAEQVVVLGYAFHEQGLKILFPSRERVYKRVFWANYGVHPSVADRFSQAVMTSAPTPFTGFCHQAISQWQYDLLSN